MRARAVARRLSVLTSAGETESPCSLLPSARTTLSDLSADSAPSREVLIVEAQFFEAGAGHVGELQLKLLRGAAGLAALGDTLHPGARGLHHLVVGAAPRTDGAVTKPHRHIVTKLRDLKALELPIATVLRDERFGFHRIILPLPSPSREFRPSSPPASPRAARQPGRIVSKQRRGRRIFMENAGYPLDGFN